MTERIVFACSGTPENCAAISVLAARPDTQVIAVTLDIGQGRHLDAARHAALTAGAARVHVLDVRDEFARDCILDSLRDAGSGRRVDQPVSRRLIARKLVEVAHHEGTATVAHTGNARDHGEIAAEVVGLDPSLCVIAVEGLAGPVPRGARTTLWGRTIEAGTEPPASSRMPEWPAQLEISLEGGLPVAVNGVPMTPAELIESVATIAGHHGVGRLVDDVTGTACEAPAAVVLQAVHDALGQEALDASGVIVRLELFQGHHRVLSAHHS